MAETLQRIVRTREEAHQAMVAGYTLAKILLDDGKPVSIRVGEDEEPKTVKQLAFVHGPVLQQIAEQVVVEGQRFTKAVWKKHLKDLFIPDKWDMVRGLVLDTKTGKFRLAKRATPRLREKSLGDLSIKQMSEFIDKTLAYATTEWDVRFDLDPLDREAVRYYPPARKSAKKPEGAEA
jgi:hypothetical protein